jgi:hypothetical protein
LTFLRKLHTEAPAACVKGLWEEQMGHLTRPGARALVVVLLLIHITFTVARADEGGGNILPLPECGKGWMLDGKVTTYGPDDLYNYIDGEAELFIPYGFSVLATAAYQKGGGEGTAIVADVYKMGSLLEAFGMYAYYRNPDAEQTRTGAEGFVEESQLMFYQDRYFVRLNASGNGNPEKSAFLSCASAVIQKLPGPGKAPEELDILKTAPIVPRSERYIAKSVLGYGFFLRGLTADTTVGAADAKVFVVFLDTPKAAGEALEAYIRSLKQAGRDPKVTGTGTQVTLETQDPLYKGVTVRQAGRYLVGVARCDDRAAALTIIQKIQSKAGGS